MMAPTYIALSLSDIILPLTYILFPSVAVIPPLLTEIPYVPETSPLLIYIPALFVDFTPSPTYIPTLVDSTLPTDTP